MDNSNDIILTRTGRPPLKFNGILIGDGDQDDGKGGNRGNRGEHVSIYRTRGNHYVIEITRWSCWDGERDVSTAEARDTAEQVIEFLQTDDLVGPAAQQAIQQAASVDDGLKAAWTETVD